jgi:hypothetical protein
VKVDTVGAVLGPPHLVADAAMRCAKNVTKSPRVTKLVTSVANINSLGTKDHDMAMITVRCPWTIMAMTLLAALTARATGGRRSS